MARPHLKHFRLKQVMELMWVSWELTHTHIHICTHTHQAKYICPLKRVNFQLSQKDMTSCCQKDIRINNEKMKGLGLPEGMLKPQYRTSELLALFFFWCDNNLINPTIHLSTCSVFWPICPSSLQQLLITCWNTRG